MPNFVLKIQDIDESGKDWSFQIDQGWLVSALGDSDLHSYPDSAPGALHIHTQRSGTDILVQGRIQTRVFASCSRCLEDVPLDLNLPIITIFALSAAAKVAASAEVEVDSGDVDREYYNGPQVVLDRIVREHILLEDPMQPLCAPGCKGIEIPASPESSSSFETTTDDGAPIDRRFAPLLKLKEKLAKNSKSEE